MTQTLYFYDLETSGFNPREQRIMQFAGQRTDLHLKPLGEPDNYLIKLSDDTLPDPDAVLLTGITPQMTLTDGLTEAEFLKVFSTDIATPGTVFMGYNSIRFDDEFMRFLHYRNFYDAYEWHWADGRGRWDMLDVVRMTRALRPDGIEWPFDSKGKPANKLELLASVNGLTHDHAHDALSDVYATIGLAQLIRKKQPKLFDYLLSMRDKKQVAKLAEAGEPFVYSSGKYPSEFHKTTVVTTVAKHPKKAGVLVYDLRSDPTNYLTMAPEKLAEEWKHFCREYPCPHPRLPVKTMQYNRCPAVAPLVVLDTKSQERIGLTLTQVQANAKKLAGQQQFTDNLMIAVELLDKDQQARLLADDQEVDGRLYDDFVGPGDKAAMRAVRAAGKQDIASLQINFTDQRLEALLPLYKARNFAKYLNDEERATWEKFRERKLLGGKNNSRAAKYFKRLSELSEQPGLSPEKQYLLEELQLYGQSILPVSD